MPVRPVGPLFDDLENLVDIGAIMHTLVADGRISDPGSAKGRLLAAAAKLFREKGYAGTTVRDLAAEVGILSGSIFHHFSNKEEILFVVMLEVVIAMEEALKDALAEAETTRDKIRALITTELDFIHGEAGNATAVLIYEWRVLSREQQQKILKGRENYFKYWHETLQQAKADGLTVIEPEYLRQLLHGALAWTTYWYKPDGKLSVEQLSDRALTLVVRN